MFFKSNSHRSPSSESRFLTNNAYIKNVISPYLRDQSSHFSRAVWSLDMMLIHWGRVTHIRVSRLTITGSDNCLSPGRRQAIIWTNAEILLIGRLGTNFSENLIEILTFAFTKMRLKVSSAKWRPFCLGLNVLIKHHWHGGIRSVGMECMARFY